MPHSLASNPWVLGARPKTLPAAIAPVLVGTSLAFWFDGFVALNALLALFVALALQVGVNYSNDYSDGVRGTDENRVGPVRLVGSGLKSASSVKRAAFLCFGSAALAGLLLTLITQQWIFIPIGLAAIVSAWFYTGGKNPYGYMGLGELFVFVWFGLAAVIGTTYSQTLELHLVDLVLAIGAGAFACAILVMNNLRDIPTDTLAAKRTLAVRLGDRATRNFYIALMSIGCGSVTLVALIAFLSESSLWPAGAALGFAAVAVARKPIENVVNGAKDRALIPVLAGTGKTQMVWAVGTSLGIIANALLR